MRKLLYFILIAPFLLNSCGGTDNTDGTEGQETNIADSLDLSDLRDFDMSKHELNIITWVPKEYYKDEEDIEWFIEPTIKHDDGEADWEITMSGNNPWHMKIEDWGDMEQSVALEKKDHEDDSNIFDFIYHEEGEDYLLYSRVLKQENTTHNVEDVKRGSNHHFYCVKKINNNYVVLRSDPMGDFVGKTAKDMLTAARASKAK